MSETTGFARTALERLHSMHPRTLSVVLDLVERYSRWPIEESKGNLTTFVDALNLVQPSHTPREATWAILQSALDEDIRNNALPWILGSPQHPLTLEELAGLVSLTRCVHDKQPQPPEAEDIADYSRELDKQFRGLASLDGDYFLIDPDFLALLADNSMHGWEEYGEWARRLTANVLLQYLSLGASQQRLHGLFKKYDTYFQASGDAVTPLPLL